MLNIAHLWMTFYKTLSGLKGAREALSSRDIWARACVRCEVAISGRHGVDRRTRILYVCIRVRMSASAPRRSPAGGRWRVSHVLSDCWLTCSLSLGLGRDAWRSWRNSRATSVLRDSNLASNGSSVVFSRQS